MPAGQVTGMIATPVHGRAHPWGKCKLTGTSFRLICTLLLQWATPWPTAGPETRRANSGRWRLLQGCHWMPSAAG